MNNWKNQDSVALQIEDSNIYVDCPFCGSNAWFIGSSYIKCFLCGTKFENKKLIQGGNIYSINMNLKFLKDLLDAGVPVESLGINND